MYMFVRKHLLSQAKFPYSKKPFKCQLVTLGEQWTVRFFFFYEQQVTVNKRREGGRRGRGLKRVWSRRVRGVKRARLSGASECWCSDLNKLLTAVKSAAEEVGSNMGRRRWEGGGGEAHWETQEVDSSIYTCISYLTHCSSISFLHFFPPLLSLSPPQLFLASQSLYNPLFVSLWPPLCYMSLPSSSVLICWAFFHSFAGGFLPYCPPAFFVNQRSEY